MIDKVFITQKLDNFFKVNHLDDFFKVFIVNFLFDKVIYIEKIVGYDDSIKMLNKYIYNLEQNLRYFKKINKYHSIYVKYNFNTKTIKYYMCNDYKEIRTTSLNPNRKKKFIIEEFKIMMYKELDKIINIYSDNGEIISNGFYIRDKYGRYPTYDGDFSKIIDIFADVEACNITNFNEKVKKYVDTNKEYYVYAKHISQLNSEVMCYVELWKKFIGEKLYYFAINNPKKYSLKMIDDFNNEYSYIISNNTYRFLLDNKDVFSLIENYLLHIKNRIDADDYNVQYHKDLSIIFQMMNQKKHITNISDYLLHESNK